VLEDEQAVLAVPDHTKRTPRLDLDVPRSERRIVIVRGAFVETGVAETFSNLLEIDGSQYSSSVDAEAWGESSSSSHKEPCWRIGFMYVPEK
jgi:hypothetical protein